MDKVIKPISVIIPTYNRSTVLTKTLNSLFLQSTLPGEIIIVDAGADLFTYKSNEDVHIRVVAAISKGAASQRMQALDIAQNPFILFMDDDIELYPDCIKLLFDNISNCDAGGVNALIVNQCFQEPGNFTKAAFWLFGGKRMDSFAGKCFGPAINLLVNETTGSSDAVRVDWMNTTCTLYKRSVLPKPLFDKNFVGYSFMEDVALSLNVAKSHKLFTVKSAKIFHDSQPGNDKTNLVKMAEMELVNRYYIMRYVMERRGLVPIFQLAGFQLFGATMSGQIFRWDLWKGKIKAVRKIMKGR